MHLQSALWFELMKNLFLEESTTTSSSSTTPMYPAELTCAHLGREELDSQPEAPCSVDMSDLSTFVKIPLDLMESWTVEDLVLTNLESVDEDLKLVIEAANGVKKSVTLTGIVAVTTDIPDTSSKEVKVLVGSVVLTTVDEATGVSIVKS